MMNRVGTSSGLLSYPPYQAEKHSMEVFKSLLEESPSTIETSGSFLVPAGYSGCHFGDAVPLVDRKLRIGL